MDSTVKELHPLEVKLLINFDKDEDITTETTIEKLLYNIGQPIFVLN